MPKLKLTKAELKAQREALHRYQRFLPTLQLKKEMLQSEVRRAEDELAAVHQELDAIHSEMKAWISLFAEEVGLEDLLQVHKVDIHRANIAGVTVRRLDSLEFEPIVPDFATTPPWVDFALERINNLLRLRLQEELISGKLEILRRELRTATQRVNLFEKVKIPACRENIRIIHIALGEEQTTAIARAKLAKSKILEWSTGA
jgi:V/A-type H+-transporting ATPase subunit D